MSLGPLFGPLYPFGREEPCGVKRGSRASWPPFLPCFKRICSPPPGVQAWGSPRAQDVVRAQVSASLWVIERRESRAVPCSPSEGRWRTGQHTLLLCWESRRVRPRLYVMGDQVGSLSLLGIWW